MVDDESRTPTLRMERGGRREFYLAELRDVPAKDDIASMSYPLFALRPGDTRVRTYESHRTVVGADGERAEEVRRVTVTPSVLGCATVHDKDVWIYCTSQLVAGLEAGRADALARRVRFTAHDLLTATRRGAGGKDYQRLLDALRRLAGTRVETDVATGGQRDRQGFGLLDEWRVVEDQDKRMVGVEVLLPDWVGRSIEARQVLTLHEDYFGLRGGLERRIYEVARAHCGRQARWQIGMPKLHEKTGSAAPLKSFRRSIKGLVVADGLPDYTLKLDGRRDVLTVYNRRPPGQLKLLRDLIDDGA